MTRSSKNNWTPAPKYPLKSDVAPAPQKQELAWPPNPAELSNQLFALSQSVLLRSKHDLQKIVDCEVNEADFGSLKKENLHFIRIRSIAFRDRRDIRKAMADFIECIHSTRAEFWYVMHCKQSIINLYVGVYSASSFKASHLSGHFKGMLPGSSVEEMPQDAALQDIIYPISKLKVSAVVTGLPTCDDKQNAAPSAQSQEEKARNGIERLIDALTGEEFTLSLIGRPMTEDEVSEFRLNTACAYDALKPYVKYQQNMGLTKTIGTSLMENESHTTGTNKSIGKAVGHSSTDSIGHNTQVSQSTGEGSNESEGRSENTGLSQMEKDGHIFSRFRKMLGTTLFGGSIPQHTRSEQHGYTFTKGVTSNKTETKSKGKSKNHSETTNKTVTRTDGETISDTSGTSKGTNESLGQNMAVTREMGNRDLESVTNRLGKLHDRLSTAPGLWKTTVMLYAHDEATLQRAVQAGFSLWRGEDSSIDPLRYDILPPPSDGKRARSQQELLSMEKYIIIDGQQMAFHPLGRAYSNLYTCLTSKEFAKMADLPHWDVPGLQVRKLVEYGRLPIAPSGTSESIEIGRILDRTSDRHAAYYTLAHPLHIDFASLNRHCFVSGITGAGKTNTMQVLIHALAKKGIPFMVIEPVKSEYRRMGIADLKTYELGADDFAINPFSFAEGPGSSLASHIDSLTSAFNALMGSYSSMPFLVNELIVKAYENKGWDTGTSRNEAMEAEWARCIAQDEQTRWALFQAYLPRLEDLSDSLLDEVLASNFGEGQSEYRNSLRGALSARLKALRRSHKGHLLNRSESFCFKELLKQNVVFEIQDFTDNDEKAFIMALLLERIYEYRRMEWKSGAVAPGLRHVVVLEEAHRLLSKASGSGSELTANPKAKAVEIFTDMLAEIRSYGQGMIIVDQIPSRLVPDVLKNTDVKITHKLTARDDREAMGAAMNLLPDQVEELACHIPGEATVSFGGLSQALHVKISPYSPS